MTRSHGPAPSRNDFTRASTLAPRSIICESVKFASRDELIGDPKVRQIYQTEIDRFNENLDRQEKIRRFALLPRDFTIEADEITPSLKVKRKMIDQKYKTTIDQLFADDLDDERDGKRA